jgi:hypothetical protein
MKNTFLIIIPFYFLFLASCDAKNDPKISYGFDVQPIFNQNCFMCHSDEENPNANLNLTSYDQLMAGDSNNGPVVISKYPENSILIDKISNDVPAFGSRMPLNLDPLSYDDIVMIERWIYFGAKDN